MNSLKALNRLIEGNQRFIDGQVGNLSHTAMDRVALVKGQNPFAIILGCSDSRVPVEIVFDQGLGDLFIVRVAGNIVAPSQIGSVEFAVEQFGTPLVVVLGHSHCGAIEAALEFDKGKKGISSNLNFIVDRIRPGIESAYESGEWSYDQLIGRAVRANVRASVSQLGHGSPALESLIADERLLIVGAEYSLETGFVDFFDGVPS
ncbi:MAG: carbonic anhydrase [Proteobacteria bacterium]|nr:carbonic anhydrase [Pseudomonadota bacterium]MDA1332149.1 carbonic anhydrase [Pseudomonadota bacterium]